MPDAALTVLQRTTCPYCGVGCGVEIVSADGDALAAPAAA
jgi:predicted molibdopterin-dependent oxidoreductase YjgC